jgi:peroxiredoxin family protein
MPIPSFDDDGDRKVTIILSKGSLEDAYAAMIMANSALGEGIETHLFFTFWGLDLITEKKIDHMGVTPVGNLSMGMPQAVAPIPGMATVATKMMKSKIAGLDVPPLREFVEMVHDSGGVFWACRMTVDMFDLKPEDFIDGVKDVVSAADMFNLAEGGNILFI